MKRLNFRRSGSRGFCTGLKKAPIHCTDVKTRVTKFDAIMQDVYRRLTGIETRLERTETDFHKEINSLTWRLVTVVCGFGTTLVIATYFVTSH
ncbi:MAG TPA: hypothetical protein VGN04_13230 [Herbaspirillum sp.]|jgi:hypothetical protein